MLLYIPIGIAMLFSAKLRKFVMKRVFQKVDIEEKRDTVWVHCASVGEVNLAEPIIKKYLDETPNQILITMMTDTGRATAEEKYKENSRIKLLFFPIDDYFAIKKILNKITLKKLILIETEIWPNLIRLCAKKSTVAMINGRISDRSIRSYTRMRYFLKKLFRHIDLFVMQTEKDRKRIIFLGANSEKVYNYGNLKFNIELPTFEPLELEELKEKLGIEDREVFVAGSTRDEEEEYVLETFDKLENTLLILVPRHIERTDDICRRLLDGKYQYEKWSNLEGGVIHKLSKKQVIIVDKIGELRKLYAICDVAYVGGTLVDIGGHSLLEPLFYGKPPIFGPYIQNVRKIAKEVLARKIGIQVKNSDEFRSLVVDGKFTIDNSEKIKKDINKFLEDNNHVVELTFEKLIEI
jgi:3-deoxy-D-manno-octulosonic-acid transferase